jgi:homoserine kinase
MDSDSEKNLNKVTVRVPGTSANCGPGFDCLGLAATIYNDLELTLLEEENLIIDAHGDGAETIPTDEKNIIWKAARMILDRSGNGDKFKGAILKMQNNIPMSRGLGSSAAAIVAGLTAANEIVGKPFTKKDILKFATEIEGHPDNVAPAIYGGFTISTVDKFNVQTFSFLPKIRLKLIVAVPDFPLSTRIARQVLPKTVSMKDAVFNVSRASMLVAALMQGKENFLTTAFDDAIHQPYRTKLVPGMQEVFQAAKKEGALGVCLSGAGPCLIAFSTTNKHIENNIAVEMVQAFKRNDVQANALILDLDTRGAYVLN